MVTKVAMLFHTDNRSIKMYYNNWPEQFSNEKIIVKPFFGVSPENKQNIDNDAFYLEGKFVKIRRMIKCYFINPEIARTWFKKQGKLGLRTKLKVWSEYAPLIIFNPDIIHCVNSSMALNIKNINFPSDPKVIVSFRGYDTYVRPYFDKTWKNELEYIYSSCDILHFVSQDIMKHAITLGAPARKCRAIYASVNTEFFKPREKIKSARDEKIKILTIGSLRWQKGYEFALPAIKKLIEKGYKIEYQIIGTGKSKGNLEIMSQRLGIRGSVIFLGRKSKDELLQFMSNTDIYLQPSVSDAFPGALREACAMGLPVIASEVDGIPEMINNGHNGLLVPICDSESIANAVEILIKTPEFRTNIAKAARKSMFDNFSIEQETENWHNLYQSLK